MFLLTVTSLSSNKATTQYYTEDNLHDLASIIDGATMEAKLRGAKTFSFNGVIISPVKVYETMTLNPPTPFKDISIVASKNDSSLLEMYVTLMEE
jgi:hypothetical protein